MAKGSEGKRDGGGGGAAVQNREQMQRINFLHQAAILVATAAKSKVKRSSKNKHKHEKPAVVDPKLAATRSQLADTRLMAMLSTQPGMPLPSVGPSAIPAGLSTYSRQHPTSSYIATRVRAEALKAKKSKAKKAKAKKAANTLSVGKIHSRSTVLGKTQEERTLPVPDRSLSSVYVKDIRSIARKSVLRIDPSVKRTLCRNCNAVLIPGVTSSVRIKPSGSHVHRVRTTCLACGVHRTIPCPPLRGENGWTEEDEAENQAQEDAEMLVDQQQDKQASEMAEDGILGDAPAEAGIGETTDQLGSTAVKGKENSKQKKPGKAKKNKRKRNLDDLVPGTRKQYSQPRFHEKKEHILYRGYEKVQT